MSLDKSEIVLKEVNELADFSEFERQMVEFEKDFGKIIYDLTNEDQRATAKSDAKKISKLQTAFQAAKMEAKKHAQDVVNNINHEGKIIHDRLEKVRQHIKDQLNKHEQAIEEIKLKISEIKQLANLDDVVDPASTDYEQRLNKARGITVDNSYGDFSEDAEKAKNLAISSLEKAFENRVIYEEEQLELKELREKEAKRQAKEEQEKWDEQIRIKEAEKVKAEAAQEAQAKIQRVEDQAEASRQQAIAAERKAKEAKRQVKDAMEQAAIQKEKDNEIAELKIKEAEKAAQAELIRAKEKIEKEAQTERQRVAEAVEQSARDEQKRKDDKDHINKVLNEAIKSLMDCSHLSDILETKDQAAAIIQAIHEGQIDHVLINY